MIRIESLRKSYGDRIAVDGLTFTARRGEILALLGPNGAGKSTTIHCLVGLAKPDQGAIWVHDVDMLADPTQAKRHLCYVPEVASLYEPLTPDEYLALKGRLFGLDEARIARNTERLLGGFDLLERRSDPMSGFSKGMTQKIAIASALLVEPQVLVLDEPLAGLDVGTTLVLKEVMREFTRRGGTLLYSSHLLDVVETLADRVLVIHEGKLQALGTMAELRSAAGGGEQRLEQLFQQLTRSADPKERARQILG